MERIARARTPRRRGRKCLLVLKRSMFAWLIADGDMQLKNRALLEAAKPGSAQFNSVRGILNN
jgi:serine/threonine-protein kinase HipA